MQRCEVSDLPDVAQDQAVIVAGAKHAELVPHQTHGQYLPQMMSPNSHVACREMHPPPASGRNN